MAFPIEYPNMYDYELYPRVVVKGRETVIHLRPTGGKKQFEPGVEYAIEWFGHTGGNAELHPESGDAHAVNAVCDENGGFTFPVTMDNETEYTILWREPDQPCKAAVQSFRMYCVSEDLAGRYPFSGDLHLHTIRSDGNQTPEIVCASYRSYGYDFLAITDHRRYYPSLDAIKAYENVPLNMALIPGEEVHMRCEEWRIDPHIINFGGEYSVNAVVEGDATAERGTAPEARSIGKGCPDVMPREAFRDIIEARARETKVPANVNALQAAGVEWVFNEIRKANGLCIYPHPNWIVNNAYHVPDALHDYMVENKLFDAFEVLGGERYYEHNGFQTQHYYDDRARGYRYPVVGSTDSHSSYPTNPGAYICMTLVMSEKNEREALIDSIKNFYSVAVDTISKEFRLVGETRMVRYGSFLLKNYFPIHDAMCYEEGRMMRLYATGTPEEREEAAAMLSLMKGRTQRLLEKYFAF